MYKVNTHSRPRQIESYRNTLMSLYYMIKESASSHITIVLSTHTVKWPLNVCAMQMAKCALQSLTFVFWVLENMKIEDQERIRCTHW